MSEFEAKLKHLLERAFAQRVDKHITSVPMGAINDVAPAIIDAFVELIGRQESMPLTKKGALSAAGMESTVRNNFRAALLSKLGRGDK